MFHTITDFIQTWQDEAKRTESLLKAFTNDTLNKPTIPGYRTLGQLASHLIETPREMLERTGLHVTGPEQNNSSLKTVQEILDEHHRVTSSVIHQVQTHWNNKSLHQTDMMYGQLWTRDQTLQALLFHLIHHRGQMTTLMRLQGLKVPGLYGPAKEEWEQYGMQAPAL
jgi:uncharacterized damage-inducible protein DinB